MRNLIIFFVLVIIIGGCYYLFKLYGGTELLNSQEHQTPADSSISMNHMDLSHIKDDKSFLEEMIPHHEEAISSSKELLRISTTPQVRELAEVIIVAQEKEVRDMKNWYKDWYGSEYKSTGKYRPMMSSPRGKKVTDAEQRFLMDMILHHQSAIAMTKKIQPVTKHDEIKQLSESIITTQEKEIQSMRRLVMSDVPHNMEHK